MNKARRIILVTGLNRIELQLKMSSGIRIQIKYLRNRSKPSGGLFSKFLEKATFFQRELLFCILNCLY